MSFAKKKKNKEHVSIHDYYTPTTIKFLKTPQFPSYHIQNALSIYMTVVYKFIFFLAVGTQVEKRYLLFLNAKLPLTFSLYIIFRPIKLDIIHLLYYHHFNSWYYLWYPYTYFIQIKSRKWKISKWLVHKGSIIIVKCL